MFVSRFTDIQRFRINLVIQKTAFKMTVGISGNRKAQIQNHLSQSNGNHSAVLTMWLSPGALGFNTEKSVKWINFEESYLDVHLLVIENMGTHAKRLSVKIFKKLPHFRDTAIANYWWWRPSWIKNIPSRVYFWTLYQGVKWPLFSRLSCFLANALGLFHITESTDAASLYKCLGQHD